MKKRSEKKVGKRIAGPDLLLIGTLLLIGSAGFAFRSCTGQDGAKVRITAGGDLYGTYDLAKEQTVQVKINGRTANTLRISGSQAKMEAADCPDKLCVHQHAISKQGETIVCLPNRVVVEIEEDAGAGLDAVSR